MSRAAALEEPSQLWVEAVSRDGLSSSPNLEAGRVGVAHGRLVCGPPSEHLLQLLPLVPMDISPGVPLSAVHGKKAAAEFKTLFFNQIVP